MDNEENNVEANTTKDELDVNEEFPNSTEPHEMEANKCRPAENKETTAENKEATAKNNETTAENEDTNDTNLDPSIKEMLTAAEHNEIEILRRLLEEDANLVNAVDKDQYTPLHRACYGNHSEVVKVLLSYGANVSAKTKDGWEPLHCAAQWDSVEAASLLLHHNANVNALTNGCLTPLHLAASKPNSRRTLELLLWHPHVNGNIRSEAGDLPFDMARRCGPHIDLFRIIDESINIY